MLILYIAPYPFTHHLNTLETAVCFGEATTVAATIFKLRAACDVVSPTLVLKLRRLICGPLL